MKKIFISVFLMAVMVFPASWRIENWRGLGDTTSITDTLDSNTVYYAHTAWSLTDGEDIRFICKVNDTAEAGFASDSVNFEWGYVLGNLCFDSTDSLIDTCWKKVNPIVLDTMTVDSFGVQNFGKVAADGSFTSSLGVIDTSEVAGFAIQDIWFVPEWAMLIRPYVKGLGDANADAKALKIKFEMVRREYSQIREK